MNVRCFICGVQKYIFFFILQNLFSTFLIFFENKPFPSPHILSCNLNELSEIFICGWQKYILFSSPQNLFSTFLLFFENNFPTPLHTLNSIKQRATKVILFLLQPKKVSYIIGNYSSFSSFYTANTHVLKYIFLSNNHLLIDLRTVIYSLDIYRKVSNYKG